MRLEKRSFIALGLALLVIVGVNVGLSSGANALTASTTLTVVNVTDWQNPDCTGYPKRDDILTSVTFSPGRINWTWDPPAWPPYPTSVTGRIWAIWCNRNGGKECSALAWDWVGNSSASKKLDGSMPDDWMGTMFSTACGEPTVDCDYQTFMERSNIYFTDNPFYHGQ